MIKFFRAVLAVAKKDLTQTLRYPTWILSMLIWPLLFPVIYILGAVCLSGPSHSGLSAFNKAAGTTNFAAYIVVGTIVWSWINDTMWTFGTYLRDEQQRGTLEANWLCPVNKFCLLIGGGLVSFIMDVMVIIISLVEYSYLYGIKFSGHAYNWIIVILILCPAVYGMGALFASLILWLKQTNAVVNVVRGAVMILCGISFPISIMPKFMIFIAKLIPFTYGIELSRQLMVNNESLSSASNNIFMCLLEGCVLLFLGFIAFKRTEALVKNSGSLERF